MALSPLDIRNKTFSVKMRGFSQEEVDDFLDQVISDYEGIIRENRDLEKKVKHAEEKLTYFNELKDALNQSIIVAQDTADKLRDNSTKEAEFILSNAEQEANQTISEAKAEAQKLMADATATANLLIDDATNKAKTLVDETDDLKKKTRSFHQRLMLLLESQLEMAKSEEWEDLLRPFSAYYDDSTAAFKNAVGETNSSDNNSFSGQTMSLDREQLQTAVEEEAFSETATVELPKFEDDSK